MRACVRVCFRTLHGRVLRKLGLFKTRAFSGQLTKNIRFHVLILSLFSSPITTKNNSFTSGSFLSETLISLSSLVLLIVSYHVQSEIEIYVHYIRVVGSGHEDIQAPETLDVVLEVFASVWKCQISPVGKQKLLLKTCLIL